MTEIYGHRWASSYGDDPASSAGQTWAKGLAGISPQQLAAGIAACIASAQPWPPTLPEFRQLCLGIPSLAAVRAELLRQGGQFSAFARLVWQHIDGYRLRHSPADKADRLIAEAYAAASEYVMRGGELPAEPVAAIEQAAERQPVPASREQMLGHLAGISELLGGAA